MKLVFLIRSLEYGGAERQLVCLAKGLHGMGHNVACAAFYPGGALEHELRHAGITVHNLEKKGRWDVIGFMVRLIGVTRSERPDILHSYLVSANLAALMLKPLFPGLKVVWGIRASNMELSRYDWLARVAFRISCWLSRLVDLIVVNSKAGRDYHIEKGFPRSKMEVIWNGIELEYFCRNKEAGQRLRGEWGISENQVLIGVVARLDPMKDHMTFLGAAAILAFKCTAVRFVCVGDGSDEYRSALQEKGRILGIENYVRWSKARPDMNAVYNAIDILTVSSSYGEGFPNVIGEAMACGTPCVVTDVGDCRRIVGDTGVVVRAKEPQELAEGWSDIMARLETNGSSVAKMARKRVTEGFSVNELLNKTEASLKHLLHVDSQRRS